MDDESLILRVTSSAVIADPNDGFTDSPEMDFDGKASSLREHARPDDSAIKNCGVEALLEELVSRNLHQELCANLRDCVDHFAGRPHMLLRLDSAANSSSGRSDDSSALPILPAALAVLNVVADVVQMIYRLPPHVAHEYGLALASFLEQFDSRLSLALGVIESWTAAGALLEDVLFTADHHSELSVSARATAANDIDSKLKTKAAIVAQKSAALPDVAGEQDAAPTGAQHTNVTGKGKFTALKRAVRARSSSAQSLSEQEFKALIKILSSIYFTLRKLEFPAGFMSGTAADRHQQQSLATFESALGFDAGEFHGGRALARQASLQTSLRNSKRLSFDRFGQFGPSTKTERAQNQPDALSVIATERHHGQQQAKNVSSQTLPFSGRRLSFVRTSSGDGDACVSPKRTFGPRNKSAASPARPAHVGLSPTIGSGALSGGANAAARTSAHHTHSRGVLVTMLGAVSGSMLRLQQASERGATLVRLEILTRCFLHVRDVTVQLAQDLAEVSEKAAISELLERAQMRGVRMGRELAAADRVIKFNLDVSKREDIFFELDDNIGVFLLHAPEFVERASMRESEIGETLIRGLERFMNGAIDHCDMLSSGARSPAIVALNALRDKMCA